MDAGQTRPGNSERLFCRLGGSQPIPLTARIAASTADNLSALAASGDFFREFAYHLNVVPVSVPALRDRREDIARWPISFSGRACNCGGRKIESFGVLQRCSSRPGGLFLAGQRL